MDSKNRPGWLRTAAPAIVVALIAVVLAIVVRQLDQPDGDGSDGAHDESPQPSPEFLAEGVVQDALSHQPIAGAVLLDHTTKKEHTTDAQGRFRFAATKRMIPIEVRAEGYLTLHESLRTDAIATIPMKPGVHISGRVVASANQAPIPGATISCGGRFLITDLPAAVTDDDGRFEVSGCDPGPTGVIRVIANHATYGGMEATAKGLAGEHVSGVVIELTEGVTLQGRVTNESGNPVGDALVSISTPRTDESVLPPTWQVSRVADDGTYTTSALSAGTWRVLVAVPGARAVSREIQTRGTGTQTEDFVIPDAGEIHGRVVTAGGQGVGGASIHIVANFDDNMRSAAALLNDQEIFRGRTIETRADGSFDLTGLAPGVGYVMRARHDVTGVGEATATPGGEPVVIELVAGATVRGIVRDAGEIARVSGGLHVVPTPLVDVRAIRRGAMIEGQFEIDQVLPGAYDIKLYVPQHQLEKKHIEVKSGETVDLEWELAEK